MGADYNFCDCKNNDPRLEQNLPISNDTLDKFKGGFSNSKNFISNNPNSNEETDLNYELGLIRIKNAVNKILRTYREYKQRQKNNDYNNKSNKNSKNYNPNPNQPDKIKDFSYTYSNLSNSSRRKKTHMQSISSEIISYIGERDKNGLKNGFGIQIWNKEAKYVGYFKNDCAEGYGKFMAGDDTYEGEFLNDGACGYGIYNRIGGTVYEGYWMDDSQETYGIEKWKDGSVYMGEYSGGKKHGIGTYYWNDGSKYEGMWQYNNLEGFGIYHFVNQRVYLGEWKNNSKNGFGIFLWPEKKFVGIYSNDRRDGFGIYYWRNNAKAFMGFWKEGKQSGFGKYIVKDKKKFGIWKDDNKVDWLKDDDEAFAVLEKYQLQAYKQIFLFNLEDIKSYCITEQEWDEILEK